MVKPLRGLHVSLQVRLQRRPCSHVHVRLATGLATLLLACGGAAPTAKTPAAPAPQQSTAERDPVVPLSLEQQARERAGRHAPASASSQSKSDASSTEHLGARVGIRGITGSLTAFEVKQAMDARQDALLACVQERPRRLGHVAGDIAFHVNVDGQGRVERVLVMQSDLGYVPLENCLAAVVAKTSFPVPAGAQAAQTQWRMTVDPLSRSAEPIDAAELQPIIERYAEAAYESCSIGKTRRFVVSGYVARKRKLSPVSVRVPWRGEARAEDDVAEQLDCLSRELETWTGWPKPRGVAKVGFELRWVAAPPPPVRAKKRGKLKRR